MGGRGGARGGRGRGSARGGRGRGAGRGAFHGAEANPDQPEAPVASCPQPDADAPAAPNDGAAASNEGPVEDDGPADNDTPGPRAPSPAAADGQDRRVWRVPSKVSMSSPLLFYHAFDQGTNNNVVDFF